MKERSSGPQLRLKYFCSRVWSRRLRGKLVYGQTITKADPWRRFLIWGSLFSKSNLRRWGWSSALFRDQTIRRVATRLPLGDLNAKTMCIPRSDAHARTMTSSSIASSQGGYPGTSGARPARSLKGVLNSKFSKPNWNCSPNRTCVIRMYLGGLLGTLRGVLCGSPWECF